MMDMRWVVEELSEVMEEDGVKMKVCCGREKGGGVGCGVVVYIRSSVAP